MPGVSIPVDESWRRIVTWLARHVPATAAAVRPPAGAEEVHRTVDAVGRPLPADLLAWWAQTDGVAEADYRVGFQLPPVYMPLPVAGVREAFAQLSRFADVECCRPDGTHATAAGQQWFGFCTATVPIGRDLSGDVLVVDLRDGAAHGCVLSWWAEEGYAAPAEWASTAAMLADTADRLEDPERTEIVEGALRWR